MLLEARQGIVVGKERRAGDEVVEAARGERVAMGRVGVELPATEVRRANEDPCPGLAHPVDLLHHPHHVVEMFQHMMADDHIEPIPRPADRVTG